MESKELIEYIKTQINNGVSKEEITKILQEQGGWADKDITDAFSVVEIDEQIQNPEVEKVEEKMEQPETNQTEQTEQPEQPELSEKSKSKTIPSHLGLLVVLLVAVIVGAGALWYMNYYTESEISDVSDMLEQVEEDQEVKNEVASSTEQELSSEELPSEYEIKADGVYYRGELIEDADPETFMILWDLFYIDSPSGYAKDKNKVFFKESEILAADVESFVLIQPFLGDDEKRIVETGMAQDINNRYYLGRRVVEKRIIDELENLGDSYYKDEVSVYREVRYSSGLHALFIPIVLDQFDAESFEFIDFCWLMEGSGSYHESYIKDKDNVFCGKEKLEKADPSTFEVVGFLEEGDQDAGIYFFSKDKNNVYEAGEIIEGANPINCTAENLEGCEASIE